MKLKPVFNIIIILSLLGCGNDDVNDSTNPCDLNPFPGINGVTQTDFLIQTFNEPDERGYLITSTITNNNLESVSGEPIFVVRVNGEIITYSTSNTASATSCLNIESESSCAFEFRIFLLQEETIDSNVNFLCFYYFDE